MRIVMNGVTGRMGYRQHLVRSILAIRDEGGFALPDGSRVQVEPVLIGSDLLMGQWGLVLGPVVVRR